MRSCRLTLPVPRPVILILSILRRLARSADQDKVAAVATISTPTAKWHHRMVAVRLLLQIMARVLVKHPTRILQLADMEVVRLLTHMPQVLEGRHLHLAPEDLGLVAKLQDGPELVERHLHLELVAIAGLVDVHLRLGMEVVMVGKHLDGLVVDVHLCQLMAMLVEELLHLVLVFIEIQEQQG